MMLREKIEIQRAERLQKENDSLNRAIIRMVGLILCGYAIGTIIGLLIEKQQRRDYQLLRHEQRSLKRN